MKYFCLSFDLEEFDIPLELGKSIDKKKRFETSFEGTERIIELVDKYDLKVTFFVTTEFCKKYPKIINKISKNHEVACHGEHDKNYQKLDENEVLKSIKQNKTLLENITGKKVFGFRAPRMLPPKYNILKELGLSYDASLHPAYVPGRYNNFLMPRKIFRKDDLVIIPTSVIPIIRIPFTWLWFRNLSLAYSKACTNSCFLVDDYVSIYFHPWEFVSLADLDIPLVIKRNTGSELCKKLEDYLRWLMAKRVEFVTLEGLVRKVGLE